MSRYGSHSSYWPPQGWAELSFIESLSGSAIAKDPHLATIQGLSYNIEVIPAYKDFSERHYIYRLSIEGWHYSIQNESHEYHVLSFDFLERTDPDYAKSYFISGLKTKSRKLQLNDETAERTYRAAKFMIQKIQAGIVPDIERVLRLYKIHPRQRILHRANTAFENLLYGGLDITQAIDKSQLN